MALDIASLLDTLRSLLCLASMLWLTFAEHILHTTGDKYYFKLTRVFLPSITMNYVSVVLAIFARNMEDTSVFIYRILLVLEALLIFDVIQNILLRRKELSEKQADENDDQPSAFHDSDNN